ncbi:hypothetical protein LTR94_025018 [Friedmanniomyces endolithicus]|nr:hypothetical protein LTR94_025018 [Friedmanniomyces endolithicus]
MKAATKDLVLQPRPAQGGRPTQDVAAKLETHILSIALQLLCANDLEGATIDAVAQAAHVSKRTLYARFPTRQALFLAVLNHAVELRLAPLRRPVLDGDWRAGLASLLSEMLEASAETELRAIERLLLWARDHDPDLVQSMFDRSSARPVRVIATILGGAADRHELEAPDVERMATILFEAAVVGPRRRMLFGVDPKETAEDRRRHVAAVVELLLGAASAPSPFQQDACYLAKAGKKVAVLERRPVIGGAACTEEMFGGYKVDIGSSIHVLFPTTGIMEDLGLAEHGLEYIELDPWGFYPIRGTDKAITFYRSLDKTCDSIAAINPRDAETYREFMTTWADVQRLIWPAMSAPPQMGQTIASVIKAAFSRPGAVRTALKADDLVRQVLIDSTRLLEELFESEELKAALVWLGAQNGPHPDAASSAASRRSRVRMTMQLAKIPSRGSTFLVGAAIGLTLAIAPAAQAAGSGMPWEQPLQQVLESVQGPVAKIVAVIVIIVTGLTLAFGESSGGFRRLIQIVFGLSIAFAASSFVLSFFSFGGGALIA